jgi:hypothetical protein
MPHEIFASRRFSLLSGCGGLILILILFFSFMSVYAATLDIGVATSPNWKVTGGGATNVSPYVVTTKVFPGGGAPGFNIAGISLTSTAETNGTWVPGASLAGFADGFWTGDYKFFLPTNAANVILSFANLYCDDRTVLMLNGVPIGAAGIITNNNFGDMVFTKGGPTQPYTFSGPDGSVSGVATSGFILGATNLLQAVCNNTHTGINGPNEPLTAGIHDQAILGMSGSISYSLVGTAPVLTGKPISGSSFQLQFAGTAGASYGIWATTNLFDWQYVGNATEVGSGSYNFNDNTSPALPRRFYRIRSP